MESYAILKALSDKTRLKIIEMLLERNYCVRALSRNLGISEPAVSQHIKVLRECGLLTGKKQGYYIHYDVNRSLLHDLAKEIDILANTERNSCTQKVGGCTKAELGKCRAGKQRSK